MRKHRSRQRTRGRAADGSFDYRELHFAERNHPNPSFEKEGLIWKRPLQKTAFLHHPEYALIGPMTDTRPDPRSAAVQNRRVSRIPAFTPVPLRARRDGWTPVRQAEFLGLLAQTRSVSKAAAFVGMSRDSAYRLRRKPGAEEFVAAWDAILGVPESRQPKITLETLFQRIRQGRYRPVLRGGRYVATIKKPDNHALLTLLGRLDRLVPPGEDWGEEPEGYRK